MSVTFTKLFSSITESSIWMCDDKVRLAWISMLAMADRHGRVWASVPGLANRARIPLEDAKRAIDLFLAPDEWSRTPDNDGRRIEPIDGGWRLLNHQKYREIRDEEVKRENAAERQSRRRSKQDVTPCHTLSHDVTPCHALSRSVTHSHALSHDVTPNHANAEADTDTETREREEDSSLSAAKKESDPSQTERRLRSWTCRISETSPLEAWQRLADAYGWERLDEAISALPAKDRWADRVEESIMAAIQIEKEKSVRAQARQAKASEVPAEAKARESPEEGRLRRLAGNLNTLERMQVGRWHVAANGDWCPGPGACADLASEAVSKQQTNEG
jgi:hypothetical protein